MNIRDEYSHTEDEKDTTIRELRDKVIELELKNKNWEEEYKELFKENEEVSQAHGGLIILVEEFVDKAKDMI